MSEQTIATWLWIISGVLGLAFSLYVVSDARKDLKAIRSAGLGEGPEQTAGAFFRNTEVVRAVQLGAIAVIGVLSLLPLTGSWRVFVGHFVLWTLVGHAWLLTLNTALSFFYRRRIKEAS